MQPSLLGCVPSTPSISVSSYVFSGLLQHATHTEIYEEK